jgi:hypothetical protein
MVLKPFPRSCLGVISKAMNLWVSTMWHSSCKCRCGGLYQVRPSFPSRQGGPYYKENPGGVYERIDNWLEFNFFDERLVLR